MSEGGVSSAELHSAISSVRSEMLSQIHELDGRIRELEAEMGQIAHAIDRMGSALASELNALRAQQREVHSTLESSLTTQQATLAANVQGFERGIHATKAVDDSVRENTSALVKTDLLRSQGDAQEPLSKVRGFAAEIDERFGQALVNVAMNRALYDDHFHGILERYDRKLRGIGEHIFRLMEEEFVPAVEQRVVVPRSVYQALAVEVDRRRIEMRGRRLDGKLAEFDRAELDPMLEMQHRFETSVSTRYSFELPPGDDSVALPAALRLWMDGDADVVVGARAAPAPERLSSDGVAFRIEQDEDVADIRAGLGARAREVAAAARLRPLDASEQKQLRQALVGLADAGRIDGDLLPGLFAYLNVHGLEVTDDATAVLPTAAAAEAAHA